MSDTYPFHATILQYSDNILTQEKLNFGVILTCPSLSFVGVRIDQKLKRISKAFPRASLSTLRLIGKELENSAKEIKLNPNDNSSDFYYKTMPKMDCSILLSEPITGITHFPSVTLNMLFKIFVLQK